METEPEAARHACEIYGCVCSVIQSSSLRVPGEAMHGSRRAAVEQRCN